MGKCLLAALQEMEKYQTCHSNIRFTNSRGVKVMVFNATFNNISVISWQSVLLVEENGVPGENHRPVTSH
jgi:hypothetical protein